MKFTGTIEEVKNSIVNFYARKEDHKKLWKVNTTFVETNYIDATFYSYIWQPQWNQSIMISNNSLDSAIGYVYTSSTQDETILMEAMKMFRTLFPVLDETQIKLQLFNFGLHFYQSSDDLAIMRTINRLTSLSDQLDINYKDKYWIDFLLEQWYLQR